MIFDFEKELKIKLRYNSNNAIYVLREKQSSCNVHDCYYYYF